MCVYVCVCMCMYVYMCVCVCSPAFAGVTIPTLDEAVKACEELDLLMLLEIKGHGDSHKVHTLAIALTLALHTLAIALTLALT